jgi:CelD/BcsL family acetyltransferase involved in cellulose biosynthesis
MPMSHADMALAERMIEPVARSRPVAERMSRGEVAITVHDLAEAEPAWRSLQRDAACTVFQTHEWLSAWQLHIGARAGVEPRIVVVRDSRGAPLFILPLAIQSNGFARELVWLGSDLCDYNAPILAADCFERLDPAAFKPLWDDVVARLQADPRSRHDLIRLQKMPPEINGRPNPMLSLTVSLNPSGSYATALSGDWEGFYKAKRSSATRRRDRSKRNHLAEAGPVSFVTAETPAAALNTLSLLVEQKSATFARHGIRNLFERPGYLDFYREIAGNPQLRDMVHISEFKVGEQTVATNLGLVFARRYYHVLASYTSGDLSRWGPGAAHLNDLLRYAIEHDIEVFDFTIGDERYKRDWCEAQPLYDHVSMTSLRGAMVAGPAMLLQKIKRTIKQTPALWAMVVKMRAVMATLRGNKTARPSPGAEADPQ